MRSELSHPITKCLSISSAEGMGFLGSLGLGNYESEFVRAPIGARLMHLRVFQASFPSSDVAALVSTN
jgi:hypothetical protein